MTLEELEKWNDEFDKTFISFSDEELALFRKNREKEVIESIKKNMEIFVRENSDDDSSCSPLAHFYR